MGGISYFTKSLLRIASLQGRGVLEDIVTGQFSLLASQGGKTLTTASANGKSFSFQVDPKLQTSDLMGGAEMALEWFDSLDSTELANLLSRRPITRTRVNFPGQ